MQHGHPKFCKIDVEGFELEVIKGLSSPIDLLSFEFHAREANVITQIFEKLRSLADYKFNLIRMNEESLLFDEWRDTRELVDLIERSELPSVGDIFVSRTD